jgi:hypothetical protein
MSSIIPKDVKKAVVFFFYKDGNDMKPLGTGFFVAVPKENDPNITYPFIVTAKHVIIGQKEVYVRLNKRDPNAPLTFERIPVIQDGKDVWFYHLGVNNLTQRIIVVYPYANNKEIPAAFGSRARGDQPRPCAGGNDG